MGTATVPPGIVGRATMARAGTHDRQPAVHPGRPMPPRAAGDSSAARAFLTHYTGTLLPLAAALVALQLGCQLLAGSAGTLGRPWPVAVAAVCGWAFAVAAWLHRRGWRTGTLINVVCAPAAVLAAPAAAGWLSPDGLLLWGPGSTVLGVALGLAAQPLAMGRSRATPGT
jgi:hypothetical protein